MILPPPPARADGEGGKTKVREAFALPAAYTLSRSLRIAMVAERFGKLPHEIDALPENRVAALLAYDQVARAMEADERKALAVRIAAAMRGSVL